MKICYDAEIIGNYDVVVCGAGPGGLCAAMAAARNGARVALVERFGIVGGNLTAGHVSTILGEVSKDTMAGEINLLLNGGKGISHNIEDAKIKLINWIQNENIQLFLLTPVVDVIMDGNRISGVIMASQTGLKVLNAKIFVDATGDGTVAFLSGAPYEMGREDGLVQPASIMFTIENVSESQTLICTHEKDDTVLSNGSYLTICKEANKTGELPENVNIVRLYEVLDNKSERLVNATHENNIDGLDPFDIAKAELSLRNQINQVVDFLRNNIEGFENCRIKDSSDLVGVRETRRILGDYKITLEDLYQGKEFYDTVVKNVNFVIDIHNPSGAGQTFDDPKDFTAKNYNLPYRAFIPKNVEGLYLCGRCISGDHYAHASYRVMNIVMAMGEAIGISAALCCRLNTLPRQLDYKLVQKELHINA